MNMLMISESVEMCEQCQVAHTEQRNHDSGVATAQII